MEERILNYLEMPEEQRVNALKDLKKIGFCPAYGKEPTMKRIMDQSVAGKMPQFYFAFRGEQLIGYLFLIGDAKRYKPFPWLAVSNEDELPMRITRRFMKIQMDAWKDVGNADRVDFLESRLEDYEHGIGHRPEDVCR